MGGSRHSRLAAFRGLGALALAVLAALSALALLAMLAHSLASRASRSMIARFMNLVPFRVGGVVFSLLGASWRLLARFWVPLGASAARFEAPGLPRRPPASILGAMFDAFLKMLEGFFAWFSAFLF